ncbi:tRNA-His guanylyltransferase [Didymella sp. IMI 355093]|nr:tRNA-His guanylyltransferase [Didymella sp. IMI 355093]
MNEAAKAVMKELPDLVIAYGNSDEYSFVFHKDCMLFERRASKLTTTIVSTFTSYYVFLWSKYLPDKPLTPPLPSFDGRAVCYPSDTNLRDYMSWRQVDCHINNLYNTTFWTLVQKGGMSAQDAEQRLSGTVSADKNEILFQEFGINYNNEPECFKKGTILYRDFASTDDPQAPPAAATTTREESMIPHLRSTRTHSRPLSQTDNLKVPRLGQSPVLPIFSAPPGPTFLSTDSTPSPPASPPKLPEDGYPNPLRSNPVSPRDTIYPQSSFPISPPSTVTSPMGKQNFTSLTPLPLSPPVLKPSSKPPLSLDAPNPTTRANFSPTAIPAEFTDSLSITIDFEALSAEIKASLTQSVTDSHVLSIKQRGSGAAVDTSAHIEHTGEYEAAKAFFAAPALQLQYTSALCRRSDNAVKKQPPFEHKQGTTKSPKWREKSGQRPRQEEGQQQVAAE